MISALIGRIVSFCSRHAWLTVIFYIALAITSSLITYNNLEITTDTTKMFSAGMDWKKRSDQMSKDFPQRENLLVASKYFWKSAFLSCNHWDFSTKHCPCQPSCKHRDNETNIHQPLTPRANHMS